MINVCHQSNSGVSQDSVLYVSDIPLLLACNNYYIGLSMVFPISICWTLHVTKNITLSLTLVTVNDILMTCIYLFTKLTVITSCVTARDLRDIAKLQFYDYVNDYDINWWKQSLYTSRDLRWFDYNIKYMTLNGQPQTCSHPIMFEHLQESSQVFLFIYLLLLLVNSV